MNFFQKRIFIYVFACLVFLFLFSSPSNAADDAGKCFCVGSMQSEWMRRAAFITQEEKNHLISEMTDALFQGHLAATAHVRDSCEGKKVNYDPTSGICTGAEYVYTGKTQSTCTTDVLKNDLKASKIIADMPCVWQPGATTATTSSGDKTSAGKTSAGLQSDARVALNRANLKSPVDFINRAIRILMAFIGSISLVLYIWSGFLWMTASGNAEQVTKAKSIMVWTTLGVGMMLASYVLASFLFKSLGL